MNVESIIGAKRFHFPSSHSTDSFYSIIFPLFLWNTTQSVNLISSFCQRRA